MKNWKAGVIGAAMLFAATGASAATIVYNVDQTIGVGGVTGTITTDGTLGLLNASDIVAWDLLVKGKGASKSLQNGSSVVLATGGLVTATPSKLLFNFSGLGDSYFLFQTSFGTGTEYWCNAANLGTCFQGASAIPETYVSPSAQVEARSGKQVIASAAVPEPASWALMIAGFGLTGALLRRRALVRAEV